MISKSWNRKYRPQKVADLHLDSVRSQLNHLMNEGRMPQTILFAGPKGTGKTSTARILGALLNDPINEAAVATVFFGKKSTKKVIFQDVTSDSEMIKRILEGNSFVVNEMDAASNRSIDDVRFLKERVSLPPQEGLITVYILDEAHMLTNDAFNALLKLLEEPPQHTLFILATTELHKIPSTIVSRCQVINFQKASPTELSKALWGVVKSEKIEAKQADIDALVRKADGSFRDVIKLAELSVKDGALSLEQINANIFGNIDSEIEKLISSMINKDSTAVMLQFEYFRKQQLDPVYLHKRLLEVLHRSLLASYQLENSKEIVNSEVAQFLLLQLSDSQLSAINPMPHLPLELKILSIIQKAQKNNKSKQEVITVSALDVTVTSQLIVPIESIESAKLNTAVLLPRVKSNENLSTQWNSFIDAVKSVSTHVGLLLQSTKLINVEENRASVAVYYEFHHQQLLTSLVQDILQKTSSTYFGENYQFCFELCPKNESTELTAELAADALM
jgi:DNA polymerase III subunit gamma/tau